jgi:hypothetical protein
VLRQEWRRFSLGDPLRQQKPALAPKHGLIIFVIPLERFCQVDKDKATSRPAGWHPGPYGHELRGHILSYHYLNLLRDALDDAHAAAGQGKVSKHTGACVGGGRRGLACASTRAKTPGLGPEKGETDPFPLSFRARKMNDEWWLSLPSPAPRPPGKPRAAAPSAGGAAAAGVQPRHLRVAQLLRHDLRAPRRGRPTQQGQPGNRSLISGVHHQRHPLVEHTG